MERALASAWEEYGAMERKSKGEGDRGRWKTGREGGQRGRVKERVAVFVLCTDVQVKEREQSNGLNRGRKRDKWRRG